MGKKSKKKSKKKKKGLLERAAENMKRQTSRKVDLNLEAFS